MTHNGSRFPINVEVPRILIFGATPDSPELVITIKSGICPSSILSNVDTPGIMISSIFTEDTALVDFRRSITWYPVITTSSISFISSSNTTVNSVCPLHFTSFVFIPTNENNNVTESRLGIVITKSPEIPVATPVVVPFKTTVTPGNIPPRESFTTPFTVTPFKESCTDIGCPLFITPTLFCIS